MVSLQKKQKEEMTIRECAPIHLRSENESIICNSPPKNELEMYLESCEKKSNVPAVQTAVTPKNIPLVASATESGIMTRLNQQKKAQEKVDAFLKQSKVFALRQDLRFKYDKKSVLIEQGTRIKIDNVRGLSDDGNSVRVDLYIVTKDDWNIEGFVHFPKFHYSLNFNIDALEKYFEPDVEVTHLMKRQSVFSHLFGTSIGLSLIWTLILSLNIFSAVTMEYLQVVLSIVGVGLFIALSVLWGVLRMRTCGAVHKRLIDAENQILQRALMQQKTIDQID